MEFRRLKLDIRKIFEEFRVFPQALYEFSYDRKLLPIRGRNLAFDIEIRDLFLLRAGHFHARAPLAGGIPFRLRLDNLLIDTYLCIPDTRHDKIAQLIQLSGP